VHLAFDSSLDVVARLAERDDAALAEAVTAAARTAAFGGVTVVRKLGARRYLSLSLRGHGSVAALPPTR
jgi:hypothetical protein